MTHTFELYFSNACVQRCPGCSMWRSKSSPIVPEDQVNVLALMRSIRDRFFDIKFDVMISTPSGDLWTDFPFDDRVFSGAAGLHLGFDKDALPADNLPAATRALQKIPVSEVSLGGNCDTYDVETLSKTARDYTVLLLDAVREHPNVERIAFVHSANDLPEITSATRAVLGLNALPIDGRIGEYDFVPGTEQQHAETMRYYPKQHPASHFLSGTYVHDTSWRKIIVTQKFDFQHLPQGLGKIPVHHDEVEAENINISLTPTKVIPIHGASSMWKHKKTHEECLSILSSLPWSATFSDFARALL